MAESRTYDMMLKKAMALCAGSEKCRADIDAKLTGWGAGEDERNKIIAKLISGRFIDEERYAAAFSRDKFMQNKWGRKKISAMLKLKGLDEAVIRTGVGSIDETMYMDTLRRLIAAHSKHVRSRNDFELRGKLIRFAAGRGFETDLVRDVVEELFGSQ